MGFRFGDRERVMVNVNPKPLCRHRITHSEKSKQLAGVSHSVTRPVMFIGLWFGSCFMVKGEVEV